MKYMVIRKFKDKYRKIRYLPGDIYEQADMERIAFLQENGYLGEKIDPPQVPQEAEKVKPDGNARQRKKRTPNKPE
jgi:hypothetical protein